MADLSPGQVAGNWGAIAPDYERAFEGLSGQFAAHALRLLGLIFSPDINRGLTELRRALRGGGRAAVVCWRDPASLQLMTLVRQAVHKVAPGLQSLAAPPVWARLSGAEALKTRMEAAGFREVEVVTSAAMHPSQPTVTATAREISSRVLASRWPVFWPASPSRR